MNYLDPGDLFRIAEAAIGSPPTVRNPGLMGSAATRPQAVVNGRESYVTVHRKAAALLRNNPLAAGNQQLAWAATAVFLEVNGEPATLGQRDAVDLVTGVADGSIDDLHVIADRLAGAGAGMPVAETPATETEAS
jgi:death-on-curing protein